MPAPWRTVRVFISSTFRDMQAERNYLTNKVFLELREWCAKRHLHLVDVDLRWGVTEKEAMEGKVVQICLDEIDRCRPFFISMLGERYGRTLSEYNVPDEPKYDGIRDFERGHSLAALEIHYGVLRDPAMKTRACFYFRDPKFINDVPEEYRGDFLPESDDDSKKLLRLKDEIRSYCSVYENYPCAYGGVDERGKVVLSNLEEFGGRVLSDLQAAIRIEYPEEALQPDALEIERNYHDTFIENSTKRFIGRRVLLNQLTEYAHAENRVALVITGKPGCGKSALLAKFAKEFAEEHAETFVLTHFIGASPGSTDIRRTMLRLCRELKQKFHLGEEVPTDYNKLLQAFPKFLERGAASAKVLLILDAVNQVDESHFSHRVEWLPHTLPPGLRVIVSTVEGECFDSLHDERRPAPQEINIGLLTDEERREIVRHTLDDYRKKLDERPENNQMGLLLSKAESDNPLYLVIACEEIRLFGEFERVTEKIKTLADKVEELFGQVLERLENLHGEMFVKDALSLIQCSRHGLLESEMLELLARAGEQQLPQAVWSRLYLSLKPYLRPPSAGDEGALDFFHSQLSKAVSERYLSGDGDEVLFHQRLAKYFRHRADPSEAGLWDGNYSPSLSELAYHLLEGRLHADLIQVACNETFLQAQANAFIEEPGIQLDTLQKALTSAAQIDDAAKMAEFMLRHARRLLQIAELSPLDALREGRLEQALNLAALIFSREKERGALWFLLLAWHLILHGRNEDAEKTLSGLAMKDLPRLGSWPYLPIPGLCRLHEVADASFLVVQTKLMDDQRQLKLLKKLLAVYTKPETSSHNERILSLAFHMAERINNEDGAHAFTEIAKAQATARKYDELDETFARAVNTAREVINHERRNSALIEIAETQAAVGKRVQAEETFAEAVKAAREISNRDRRARSLIKIGQAQATAGQSEDARKTARSISSEEYRAGAWGEIVKAQTAIGEFEEAIKTAEEINDHHQRASTQVVIIEKQAAIGDFGKATARALSFRDGRASALIAIAKVLIRKVHAAGEDAFDDLDIWLLTLIGILRLLPFIYFLFLFSSLGAGRSLVPTIAVLVVTCFLFSEYLLFVLMNMAQFLLGVIVQLAAKLKGFARIIALSFLHRIKMIPARNPCNPVVQTARETTDEAEVLKTFEETLKSAGGMGSEDCRVISLIEIARAQVVALRAQAADKTFEGALKTARAMDKYKRTTFLSEIARAQASAGRFEGALKTAREIDRNERVSILGEIAQAQAAAGQPELADTTFEEVLKLVRAISDEDNETKFLRELMQRQATAGRFEGALKTAGKTMRAEALSCIAEAQAVAGKFEEALKTAGKIRIRWWEPPRGQHWRLEALIKIAAAQATVGKSQEADETFQKAIKVASGLEDYHRGYFESSTGDLIDLGFAYDREEAFHKIVHTQIAIGKFEEALKTAKHLSWWESDLKEIVKAQVASGKLQQAEKILEEALMTAREIKHKNTRAFALIEIAAAQIMVGKVEKADKTCEEALMIAGEIGVNHNRDGVLTQIATTQVAAGEFEKAVKTAQQTRDDYGERAEISRRITEAQAAKQAAAGQFEKALRAAREINSEDDQAEALSKIAEAQAAVGESEAALKTAKEIISLDLRAKALSKITGAQVAIGKFEEALKTAMEVRSNYGRADSLKEIAKAQAATGRVEETIRTIQMIGSENVVPQVAEILVSREAKDDFKQLLASASYHLSASYKMCGLLAKLYSHDEEAIDKIATLVMS